MAKNTFGTTFQLSATTISGTTGKFAAVQSVGFPNPQQGTVDTTHHESTSGIKEFLPSGLVEFSEMKVKIQVTPGDTTDTACVTAATSRAVYFWKLNSNGVSAAYVYSGSGIVTGYEIDDAPLEGVYSATVTIKPTGAITRA